MASTVNAITVARVAKCIVAADPCKVVDEVGALEYADLDAD